MSCRGVPWFFPQPSVQLAEALKQTAGEEPLVAGLVLHFALDFKKISQQGMRDKHYTNGKPDWLTLALSAGCGPASQLNKAIIIFLSCAWHPIKP